jgi:molybdenum cofactor cytidylyltransferase
MSSMTEAAAGPESKLYCVVLAAGTSSRFGSLKQLADFRGQPLVARAMRLAEESFGQRCILVVGHEWQQVAAACEPLTGFLVVNPDHRRGFGGSIAAGVSSVAKVASGVLLLLADQPLIDSHHLRRMTETWTANPDCIVASEFDAVLGPPVIFPARLFDTLSALQGDRGAHQILQDEASRVIRLECPDAAFDIDEADDLGSI